MKDKKETFTYSYSARQQEEINNIRRKYLPEQDDKMEQLRRLDESVTRKGMIASLSVCVISVLILGLGMCCSMVWSDRFFAVGIIVGIIGIAGIAAAYPLYNHIIKRERERVAPQILRLSEELLHQSNTEKND